jgi:ubiquinone/menaquinone biosynthesis C-methylase UbiE
MGGAQVDKPSLRKSIRQGFDKIAAAYAPIRTSTGGREAREFVRWIHPRRRDCVLDAACGPAILARRFIGKVKRVCAVDICERMIHLTCRPAGPGTKLLPTVADVEQLPYASKSFQLVTCGYAFANFPDPLKVLREFARVTEDNGRIALLEVIAPEDPVNCSQLNLIESLRSDFYTRILGRSQFIELFRAAGLRLECSEFHVRYQNWHEWLRLSPAAADRKHARRLREILLQSSTQGKAGPITRREDGKIVLRYETAWFLLRRLTSAPIQRASAKFLRLHGGWSEARISYSRSDAVGSALPLNLLSPQVLARRVQQ